MKGSTLSMAHVDFHSCQYTNKICVRINTLQAVDSISIHECTCRVHEFQYIMKASLVPRLLVGGERKLLFAHARNYLLLNTCLDKSGRGTRNTYPRDW